MASTETSFTLSTRTSPMGSVFTPPLPCSTHWTYEDQNANGITGGLLIQAAQLLARDSACLPPGFDGFGRAPSFIQVFSPGVCPFGYTTAGNFYAGAITTAVCCLSNFSYVSTVSTVHAGDKTAQYFGCTSIYPAFDPVTTVFAERPGIQSRLDGTYTNVATVSGPITMWAQPLTVAFQKSDLVLFTTSTDRVLKPSTGTTSPATTSPATTSPATTSPPTTSPPATISSPTSISSTTKPASPTVTPGAPGWSLSSGTIAGVAIGAAAVLGLLIGGAILFRKKRKSSGTLYTAADTWSNQHDEMRDQNWAHPPNDTNNLASNHSKSNSHNYLTNQGYSEAPSQEHTVWELPNHLDQRQELPS